MQEVISTGIILNYKCLGRGKQCVKGRLDKYVASLQKKNGMFWEKDDSFFIIIPFEAFALRSNPLMFQFC